MQRRNTLEPTVSLVKRIHMTYIRANIEAQAGIPYLAPVWLINLGGLPLFVVMGTQYWMGLN